MSTPYDELVRVAAARAAIDADPTTHVERRRRGWRRFNVMLPPEIHRAYKIRCLQEQIDMSDVAHALIVAWLEAGRPAVTQVPWYDEGEPSARTPRGNHPAGPPSSSGG